MTISILTLAFTFLFTPCTAFGTFWFLWWHPCSLDSFNKDREKVKRTNYLNTTYCAYIKQQTTHSYIIHSLFHWLTPTGFTQWQQRQQIYACNCHYLYTWRHLVEDRGIALPLFVNKALTISSGWCAFLEIIFCLAYDYFQIKVLRSSIQNVSCFFFFNLQHIFSNFIIEICKYQM